MRHKRQQRRQLEQAQGIQRPPGTGQIGIRSGPISTTVVLISVCVILVALMTFFIFRRYKEERESVYFEKCRLISSQGSMRSDETKQSPTPTMKEVKSEDAVKVSTNISGGERISTKVVSGIQAKIEKCPAGSVWPGNMDRLEPSPSSSNLRSSGNTSRSSSWENLKLHADSSVAKPVPARTAATKRDSTVLRAQIRSRILEAAAKVRSKRVDDLRCVVEVAYEDMRSRRDQPSISRAHDGEMGYMVPREEQLDPTSPRHLI